MSPTFNSTIFMEVLLIYFNFFSRGGEVYHRHEETQGDSERGDQSWENIEETKEEDGEEGRDSGHWRRKRWWVQWWRWIEREYCGVIDKLGLDRQCGVWDVQRGECKCMFGNVERKNFRLSTVALGGLSLV